MAAIFQRAALWNSWGPPPSSFDEITAALQATLSTGRFATVTLLQTFDAQAETSSEQCAQACSCHTQCHAPADM
eukprot:9364567-Alexandrium_andersonii.AAC.1